ncbi:MAG: hypothetical protein E5X77_43545, partial [Mesorhizobium sp.]
MIRVKQAARRSDPDERAEPCPFNGPDSRRGAFWPKKCDSNQSAERIFDHTGRMWNPIASAPPGRNLELAVIDDDGVHALV